MSLAETANDNAVPARKGEEEAVTPPPAAPPLPVPLARWKVPLYMASSVLFFLTQGLGMNLITANIYQLQGSFSATTIEVSWLSAAYMAPYASLAIALSRSARNMACAGSPSSASSAFSSPR